MNFSKYNESIWNSLGEKNNKKTKKMAHVLHGPSKKKILPRNTCPRRIYFSTAQHHIWKEAEKSSLPTWIEQNLGENASPFQVFRSEVCPNQRCGRRYLPTDPGHRNATQRGRNAIESLTMHTTTCNPST